MVVRCGQRNGGQRIAPTVKLKGDQRLERRPFFGRQVQYEAIVVGMYKGGEVQPGAGGPFVSDVKRCLLNRQALRESNTGQAGMEARGQFAHRLGARIGTTIVARRYPLA